ncbi:unnamed protein product [Paramecium sonneborni]|uniref:Protein kinase domain-containing protein n=1 Tax=Paramecium sonneborni TaxID=65129 RepID=A0A8S1LC43_9CILI|nr:unnamed protein product [Paramecium sonneborni]
MAQSFEQKYIAGQLIQDQNTKKIQRVKQKGNQKQNEYISLHIKKGINLSEEELNNLISCRFLNLLPIFDKFEHNGERIIVYKDYLNFILEENSLQDQITAKRILLQLFLTFAELEERKYYWPLNSIQQLYYYKEMMFLSLIEYDFSKQNQRETNLEILKRFYTKYFSQIIKIPDDLLQENSFEQIINFLLKINGDLGKQDYLRGPYENLLQNLFKVKIFNKIYDTNQSIVKYFQRPENFICADEQQDQQIVYKTLRKQNYEGIVELQTNRQIEFLELFYNCSHMAVGYAYFRVLKQPFFFMRKYYGTLQDKFSQQEIQQINQKTALQISSRIAYALMELQKNIIIHRDLKPDNLYLDKEELIYSAIYVADFDRSKVLMNQNDDQMTIEHQSNTCRYDPPETDGSLKYDIFQYGLIILQLANKGQYVGNENAGCRYLNEEELHKYYSEQSIANQLNHTQYPQKFIELIARCLKMKPKDRPSIQEVYEILKDLCQRLTIKKKN